MTAPTSFECGRCDFTTEGTQDEVVRASLEHFKEHDHPEGAPS